MPRGPEKPTRTAPLAEGSNAAPADDAPLVSPQPRDPTRYRLLAEHGRGGLGRIYRARDRELGRDVALKELLQHTHRSEARFFREVYITARLEHPGIVPVHEAGRWPDGTPFYSMKLVAGRPLSELLSAAKTLDARLALLPHLIAVADAIAYAHDRQTIHRDLKPSNVIVGDFGETIVIDWGLAKELAAAEDDPADGPYRAPTKPELTAAGSVMGTPAYMSPEQARGEHVDTRTDVYSLGAMLFQLCCGAAPPTNVTATGLRQELDHVPEDLAAIAVKSLSLSPDDRYFDAGDFAADLRAYDRGARIAAREYSAMAMLLRWLARHRAAVAMTAVALTAIMATGAYSLRRVILERDRAERASRKAEQRAAELILVQAQTNLDTDPTATLAWLKTYPEDGKEWARARDLAADAKSRGVARSVIRAHRDSVLWTAFEPRGERFVTSSQDRTLRLWSVKSGAHELLTDDLTIEAHAALSPDGSTVAYEDSSNRIVIMSLNTRAARVLSKERVAVLDLAFSPNGRHLAAAGSDGNVRVWDLATEGDRQTSLIGHRGKVQRVLFAPDGAELASTSEDGTTRTWDIATSAGRVVGQGARWIDIAYSHDGQWLAWSGTAGDAELIHTKSAKRRTLPGSGALIGPLTFSPDGALLAACSEDNSVLVWDVVSGGVKHTQRHEGIPTDVAFSPDSRLLAAANLAGPIHVIDFAIGDEYSLRGHRTRVYALEFSPTHSTLVTGDENSFVRVWDIDRPQTQVFRGHKDRLFKVAFTRDGRSVVSTSADHTLRLWDLATGSGRPLIEHGHLVNGLAVAPDGSTVASSSYDGTARVWSLATGQATTFAGHEGIVWQVAYSPDSSTLATGSADGTVRLWDTKTGAMRVLQGHAGDVFSIAFASDGSSLASGGQDGTVRIWSQDGEPLFVLTGHSEAVNDLAYAPTLDLVASGSSDSSVRLWDLRTGETSLVHEHSSRVRSVSFSPDGTFLASASDDGNVRVRAVRTSQETLLTGHSDAVRHLAFRHDNAVLATASQDGTVRLWDLRDGKNVVLRGHDGYVRWVSFSPTGNHVASASSDATWRLWPVNFSDAPNAKTTTLRAWLDRATSATIDKGCPNRSETMTCENVSSNE